MGISKIRYVQLIDAAFSDLEIMQVIADRAEKLNDRRRHCE